LTDDLTTNFDVDNDWAVSGPGLAGVNGVPVLSAQGALIAAQAGSLDLAAAAPFASTYLVLGFNALSGAFKGGVLVPSPDVVLSPLTSDGGGALQLPFSWPQNVPSGTQIWAQYWVQDAVGPVGFSASNGLVGTGQ